MFSINVLLTTIGREELRSKMLASLALQLNENDYLTVISDANHDFVANSIKIFKFKCNVTHIINDEPLGFWGHGSRNKYQNTLPGDFIMNADDDDRYVPKAFDFIRQTITDKNKLYLFRVQTGGSFSWATKGVIKMSEIGTTYLNGVIL